MQNRRTNATAGIYPSYIRDREAFAEFVDEFEQAGEKPYRKQLEAIALRTVCVFILKVEDITAHGLMDLTERIVNNALSYVEEFSSVIDDKLSQLESSANGLPPHRDPIDLLAERARHSGEPLPTLLIRRFELILELPSAEPTLGLRSLRSVVVGRLVKARGMIVAATAVRPKLLLLTSVCDQCGEATFQHVTGDRLTPMATCPRTQCGGPQSTSGVGRLLSQWHVSRFVEYMELRLQELPEDVPRGAVPRTLRITCEGQAVPTATPGQIVHLTGVLVLDLPSGSAQASNKTKSLLVQTRFSAMSVQAAKTRYTEAATNLQERLRRLCASESPRYLADRLVRSIAPEIWGHLEVKRVLACLLMGGEPPPLAHSKALPLRSDLNVCLVGDPGVAKSQLLKWVAAVAPRSVYTTGKGSSGVGLTAAVARDPNTGETVLEGGALVLADRGVCCIDEFDKMAEMDRTALHEVMEQQSVSVAKAGIVTTLNARTSVLAAANPKRGRWDRRLSIGENLQLPPALLSRFDVVWLLLDEVDARRDLELAQHITRVHVAGGGQQGTERVDTNGDEDGGTFTREMVRAYIGVARAVPVELTPGVCGTIDDLYVDMRRRRSREEGILVTPRTLLGVIRLSQALARLRLSQVVEVRDAQEAASLFELSSASLQTMTGSDLGGERLQRHGMHMTAADIFGHIKRLASQKEAGQPMEIGEIRQMLMVHGVEEEALQSCLSVYESLAVLRKDGDHVMLMSGMSGL